MKAKLSRMLRSGLALLLAFSLVVGYVPAAVFATGDVEPAKKYVSLGDSMTNGYGLDGYDVPHKVNGFLDGVDFAYPAQLEGELNFNLIAQLATSAMRAEDLNYILRYPNAEADPYTEAEFINGRWNDYAGIDASKAGAENVAKIFQEKVAAADVISYAVGNANFGVFLMYRITNLLGIFADEEDLAKDAWIKFEDALAKLDAEQKEVVLGIYGEVMNILKSKLPEGATPLVDGLGNIFGFTIASYLANVDASLDRINELNPDAEIILVGIMNTFSGMKIHLDWEGQAYDIEMSALLAPIVEGVNAYLAALPTVKQAAGEWTGNTFYYAAAPSVQMLVETYKVDITGNNVIRDRFIEQVCEDTVFPMIAPMFREMLGSYDLALDTSLTREDVEAYETDPESLTDPNKVLSAAVYLAFEQAVLESTDLKVLDATAFMKLATGLDDIFTGVGTTLTGSLDFDAVTAQVTAKVMEAALKGAYTYEANIAGDSEKAAKFKTVKANATSMDGVDEQLACVVAHYVVEEDAELSSTTVDAVTAWAMTKYADVVQKYTAIYAGAAITNPLKEALVADETIVSLLNLFARMLIGNGIGCHPSEVGHDTLTAAIVASYKGNHTAADQTKDNLTEAAKVVADLVAEYYDDAYAYAYAEAAQVGYISDATEGIQAVIDALAAIDLSGTEMTDEFKAEVAGEIEEIIETLAAAKALIAEADVLDDATYTALMAMLDEAGEAIENLLNVLAQAGADVNDLVVTPALKAAKEELIKVATAAKENLKLAVQAGTEFLMEKLGDTYNALLDLLMETIREQAGEAADWIYNWLLNNPDKVIAWINAYGDDIVDFVTENAEAFGAVISFLILNFGEDVAEFVMNNANEILATMIQWFETHGENAWELIKAYLVELGIIDAINDAISDVQGSLDAIIELLKKYAPEVNNAVIKLSKDVLDNVRDAAKKLIQLVEDEIKNFINNVKPGIEANIKKLQKELDALKKELADLYAKLETATGEAKKQIGLAIIELEKKIAKIEAAIEALQAELAEIPAKLEALKDAALALNAAIEKAIAEGIDAAATEIQAALYDVVDAILDAINVVSDEAAAELNKIVQDMKDALNNAYVDAITAEYEINAESYYVAIGDDTAVSESYVDVLAVELAELAATEDYTYNYVNLAKTGMTLTDVYGLLKTNATDIAKADLITLGFGNNGFTDATVANLTAALMGETPDFDWSTYVTKDGVPYVEDAIAEVRAKLVEAGIQGEFQGVNVVDMLTLAIESYAYNYVAYACNLPEVVNAINKVNDDALVLVVGMHNPMEHVVLTLDENTSINLGEYLQYLVDAVNVHAVAYAMVDGKVTYVAAPAVETGVTDAKMNAVQFLMSYVSPEYRATLNPTAAGHAYIADQILNAVDVTVADALWDISFANMTLSSSLAMNFAFAQDEEADWSGYYAKIVKTYADRADVVEIIPAAQWGTAKINGKDHYTVTFKGIAAKEMGDDIYVTIYNADGVAQSYVWIDNTKAYADRLWKQTITAEDPDYDMLVLIVDMLNYGAAAQSMFKYDTDNLVNADLTKFQQSFATESVEAENTLVQGDNYYASSLSLKSEIRLYVAFSGVTEDMTANVTFTKHTGREIDEAAEIVIQGNLGVVHVDQIAVADGRTDVTVTVYNADGTVYGTVTDSLESYIARVSDNEPENADLYEKILMFCDAAYAALH